MSRILGEVHDRRTAIARHISSQLTTGRLIQEEDRWPGDKLDANVDTLALTTTNACKQAKNARFIDIILYRYPIRPIMHVFLSHQAQC